MAANRTALGLGIAMVLVVSAGAFFAFQSPTQEPLSAPVGDEREIERPDGQAGGGAADEERAIIETKFGRIVVRFFPAVAPEHVKNFITLARSGFYDGTTFHRVIPGFMIQGGDPNTKDDARGNDGAGGPGYMIKAEFSDRTHKRGAVSMARLPSGFDTAGSQFFIVVGDSPFLDRQYTIFGEVIQGMDVVDRIVGVERDANDNPLERIEVKVTVIGPQ